MELVYSLIQLFSDLPHTFYIGMTSRFADILQLYHRHTIMFADGGHRFGNLRLEAIVRDEVYVGRRIALLDTGKHSSHGRTKGVEIGPTPIGILILTDGRTSPRVVGTAKD